MMPSGVKNLSRTNVSNFMVHIICQSVRSKKLKRIFLIDPSRNKKNGPISSTLMQMTLHFRTEGSLSLDHPVQGASTFISLDRPFLIVWMCLRKYHKVLKTSFHKFFFVIIIQFIEEINLWSTRSLLGAVG